MNEFSHSIDVLLNHDDISMHRLRVGIEQQDDVMARAIEITIQKIDKAFAQQKRVKATVRPRLESDSSPIPATQN